LYQIPTIFAILISHILEKNIVAIIGATFAYFSAQASTKDGDISGGTSDVGAALSLNVTRDLVEASSEEGTTVILLM